MPAPVASQPKSPASPGAEASSDAKGRIAILRVKVLRAGLASYFIQVNTEDYVEDRLLKDCQDDGRPAQ